MTIKKSLIGALVLASAAGGPYVLMETETGSQAAGLLSGESAATSGWLTSTSSDDESESGFWNANGASPLPQISADGLTQAAPQTPIHALQQVLRFDATPDWVMQKFPQVTTVLSEWQMDGMRVALITGTTPSDLAGTLTYYFDRYQRVQRIQIHAVTGDPSRSVAELQHAYQLQQQPALGGRLYLRKWNGRPTSLVYTTPAPVIKSNSPYGRYNVFIELNQAGLEYGISTQAQQLLESGRRANRWQ